MQDIGCDFDKTVPGEWRATGYRFIEQRAQRKQIAAAIDGAADRLFRRKVSGRSQHHSAPRFGRQQRLCLGLGTEHVIPVQLFCQPEIQHLNLAAIVNHYV